MNELLPPPSVIARRDAALVFVLSCLCLGWAIGAPPLAGTEGHRALTAHQMVQSGQYLLPKLYGQLYLRKPPLHYWTMAALERATGITAEWLWRLPSLLSTATMAAFLCWRTGVWFGRAAGLVAGFACLSQVALWSAARAADLDAMHVAATVIAAWTVLELGIPQRPGQSTADGRSAKWGLAVLAGLAMGASLLIKGHSGLPVILGAAIGPAIINRVHRPWRCPGVWVAMLVGAACFGAYALAAWYAIQSQGLRPDLSGLTEAVGQIHGRKLSRILGALALPFVLTAFAFPSSLALLAAPQLAKAWPNGPQRLLFRGLLATWTAGLVIFLLATVYNYRYAYVILPMLAPLAGAAATAWREPWAPPLLRRYAPTLERIAAVGLLAGGVVLIALAWPAAPWLVVVVTGVVLPAAAAVWLQRQWFAGHDPRGLGGLVAMIVCMGISFAYLKNAERTRRSAINVAPEVRRAVGDQPLLVGLYVRSKPELLHYAGITAIVHSMTPIAPPPAGGWALLTREEHERWSTVHASCIVQSIELRPGGSHAYLVMTSPRPASRDP